MIRFLNLKIHGRVLWFKVFYFASFFLFVTQNINAAVPVSYRLQHPIGWMHLLPVGETPGWEKSKWLSIELSHGNVWNAPITLVNNLNNKEVTYSADFAQSHLILEIGGAFSEMFAHSLVIPYSYRGGGFLDGFIDDYHIAFGFDRFNRADFPEDHSRFSVISDGVEKVTDSSASGISNLKYKLKFWPWQIKGNNGQCACGFGISAQVKIPMDNLDRGLSTESGDYSLMWNLGFPIFDRSAIWISSAVTRTKLNPLIEDLPRKEWHQMYEISTEWGLNKNWSFTFQVRMESPILEKDDLSIANPSSEPVDALLERIASGWNSLVHWRGSEAFGLKYNSNSGEHQFKMMIIEDWAVGHFDEIGDDLYVNNAPDVAFSMQYSFAFE